jgi:hypothetical protein
LNENNCTGDRNVETGEDRFGVSLLRASHLYVRTVQYSTVEVSYERRSVTSSNVLQYIYTVCTATGSVRFSARILSNVRNGVRRSSKLTKQQQQQQYNENESAFQ